MRVNQTWTEEVENWHRIDLFYLVDWKLRKTDDYDDLIVGWLNENCHGLWCWRQRLDYSFQDASDAMLFKLRWMPLGDMNENRTK